MPSWEEGKVSAGTTWQTSKLEHCSRPVNAITCCRPSTPEHSDTFCSRIPQPSTKYIWWPTPPLVKMVSMCRVGSWQFPTKVTPSRSGRLTWNLQIPHLERKTIFQTSMIMFHVNLQGCKSCDLQSGATCDLVISGAVAWDMACDVRALCLSNFWSLGSPT